MSDTGVMSSVDTVRDIWCDKGLDGHLGIQCDHVGDGEAQLSMEVRHEHLNLFNSEHGGALFAIADSAFALACNTRGHVNVASGCSIEFLRPAMFGDKLVAVAKWVDTNGRSSIYTVTISNDKDEIVAIFTGRSHQTSKLVSEFLGGEIV